MISKNFARCIAKISGDGNLYWGKSTRYLRYSNTCKELLEEFQQDINEEFGETPLTRGINNSGVPFVQTNRKAIMEKFLANLKDFRSNAIYIPDSIKNADSLIQQNYLRALYDDEGCAGIRLYVRGKEWKRNINLTSNSLKLLEEVKLMLFSFGICTNKIYRTKPNSLKDKSYTLTITGKENIVKFKDFIGFKHPLKAKKLDLMIKSYSATSKNIQEFKKLKMELMFPSK